MSKKKYKKSNVDSSPKMIDLNGIDVPYERMEDIDPPMIYSHIEDDDDSKRVQAMTVETIARWMSHEHPSKRAVLGQCAREMDVFQDGAHPAVFLSGYISDVVFGAAGTRFDELDEMEKLARELPPGTIKKKRMNQLLSMSLSFVRVFNPSTEQWIDLDDSHIWLHADGLYNVDGIEQDEQKIYLGDRIEVIASVKAYARKDRFGNTEKNEKFGIVDWGIIEGGQYCDNGDTEKTEKTDLNIKRLIPILEVTGDEDGSKHTKACANRGTFEFDRILLDREIEDAMLSGMWIIPEDSGHDVVRWRTDKGIKSVIP